ncbi:hypothetical protein Dvar_04530 [Desulfosarcina variabilis str. Montpellier]|uniref:hypothetical protein n=1 Tax=Desulfosarcina variabilis TaxID=2300 RepID=UPI003AFB7B8B
MKPANQKKVIQSSIGILVAVLLFFTAGIKLPLLDTMTDTYFQKAITKAGLAYATCRTVNAAVSIVQESTLQLEPAGVGLSLAVGQALDPINDMTERLSDVLVTAITSLGVQKLAYEMGISFVPPVLAIFLFLLSILIWFDNLRLNALQKTLWQILLLVAVFRFCLPVSSMANEFVYHHFFDEQINAARSELALGSAELDKLKDLSMPEIDGVMGTIENSAFFLKKKSFEFKNALVYTVSNMGNIIENLMTLTFLYVGIFLIQVIVLPLLSFWLMVKMAGSLFPARVAGTGVILHPHGNRNKQPVDEAR